MPEKKHYLEKLKRLRKMKMWSQGDVAERLNINYTTYGKVELGQVELTVDRAMALAKMYGISISELLEDSSYPEQEDIISMVNEEAETERLPLNTNIVLNLGECPNTPAGERFLHRLGRALMEFDGHDPDK